MRFSPRSNEDRWHGLSGAEVLLRFTGGADALSRVILEVAAEGGLGDWVTFDAALEAIVAAGPRAAAVRPVLLRLRSEREEHDHRKIDRALAAIGEDPEALALTTWFDDRVVARLLACGQEGRRGLVLYASHFRWGSWQEQLAGVPMEAEIVAASRPSADDPHAQARRTGAARLAWLLPLDRALRIHATVLEAGDCDPVVAEELLRLEERSAGAVPTDLVRRLLERPEPVDAAFDLAGAIGPRGEELVPMLRRIRDAGHPATSPRAAIALWRMTQRAEESLPTLRALLRSQRFWDRLAYLDVHELGSAYASMPLTTEDLDVLLVACRRFPEGLGPFAEPFVRCLERFGPAAAPAVPQLRRMLDSGTFVKNDEPEPIGPAPVRVLGAIGPAARDAIPDIRKWASLTGDPGGVAREAIRKIESGAK